MPVMNRAYFHHAVFSDQFWEVKETPAFINGGFLMA